MRLPRFFPPVVCTVLVACGASANQKPDAGDSPSAPALASAGPGDCLLTYQRRLDDLLPKGVLEKHLGASLAQAKLDYRKSEKYPKYDTYAYVWPSERLVTRKIGNSNISYPEENRIGLSWTKSTPSTTPTRSSSSGRFTGRPPKPKSNRLPTCSTNA